MLLSIAGTTFSNMRTFNDRLIDATGPPTYLNDVLSRFLVKRSRFFLASMLSSLLDEDEDDFDSVRPGCSGLACTEAGCGMYIGGIIMNGRAQKLCDTLGCVLKFDMLMSWT